MWEHTAVTGLCSPPHPGQCNPHCCVLQLQKTTSELEKTKEELKNTQKDLKNADKEILVRISFLMASCQLLQTGLQLQSQELCWLLLSD